MNLLFVGGPLDGVRQPVSPKFGCVYNTFDQEDFNPAKMDRMPLTIKTSRYFMRAIGSYRVMLHETETGLLDALIKGYHRHRKPNRWPRRRYV